MTKQIFFLALLCSLTTCAMELIELVDQHKLRNQLINGILKSNETTVILALTQYDSLNVPGKKYGRDDPPLCVAAANGCHAIVELLVANGAQTDITDGNGDTPLHNAVRFGHLTSAQILYDAYASLYAKNMWGQTVLHEALELPKPSYSMIEWLLSKGVPVDEPDDEGNTAAHLAFAKNRNDIVELLDDYNVDWDIENEDGLKPVDMPLEEGLIPEAPPPPPLEQRTISFKSLDDILGYFYPREETVAFHDAREEFEDSSHDSSQDSDEDSGYNSGEYAQQDFVDTATFFRNLFLDDNQAQEETSSDDDGYINL